MDEKLGTRCGTFFVMVGFSSLMLRLHFIHIIITVCVCVYSVEAHDFYENTTAARIFGSFFAFCRLQCVPFAFISPYYFQYISVGFFCSVIERVHTHTARIQKPRHNAHRTMREQQQQQQQQKKKSTTKKKWFYVLFICYLRAVAYLKVEKCRWSGNVNAFCCCCNNISMPLFMASLGYVQRMLCVRVLII